MKPKKITLPDGTVIIDGLSKLLVIDREFAEEFFPVNYEFKIAEKLRKGVRCHALPFVTKKGRESIQVYKGESHVFRCYWGTGDRSWKGWEQRRIINGLFSDARSTSNGGGCWLEVEIWGFNANLITAEEYGYIDELY